MIKKIFLLIVVLLIKSFPQQIDFQSPENIKLFADFLFCEKDYLRSIGEFEKYLMVVDNDSIRFKVALSYSYINDYAAAINKFRLTKITSPFYDQSRFEILKSLYLQNKDSLFYSSSELLINSSSIYSNNAHRLRNTTYLLIKNELIEKEKLLIPFLDQEKQALSDFYDFKKDPPYKSETTAVLLSIFIPGAGKLYTKNYGDGITAFLLTGLFSYLAYTNFEHNHPARAWIFTALGAGFYAGNIYGSAASAQIFNAKVDLNFKEGVKLFLEQKEYFAPKYEFCN
jgi:TM2 domain-containing membrane protein YozV